MMTCPEIPSSLMCLLYMLYWVLLIWGAAERPQMAPDMQIMIWTAMLRPFVQRV